MVISRKEYEKLLHAQNSISKSIKTFKPTITEKKAVAVARKRILKGEYLTLEARLQEAEKDIQMKRTHGPFHSIEEFHTFLDRSKKGKNMK